MDWNRNDEWNMYYGADSITKRRPKNLRSNLTILKIKAIRFKNDEVLDNIDEVINSIQEKIYEVK